MDENGRVGPENPKKNLPNKKEQQYFSNRLVAQNFWQQTKSYFLPHGVRDTSPAGVNISDQLSLFLGQLLFPLPQLGEDFQPDLFHHRPMGKCF